jgi:hypothetical protein
MDMLYGSVRQQNPVVVYVLSFIKRIDADKLPCVHKTHWVLTRLKSERSWPGFRKKVGDVCAISFASSAVEDRSNTNSTQLRRSSVPRTQWYEARCAYS